ncbi:MAG: flagellar hook-associated protein FlgL [Acidimicrobiales bacterium]
MMSRVATNSGARMMLGNLQTTGRSLMTAQEQATTGKRINRMSDNPADAVNILGQKAVLRRLEQYARNSDEASSWLSSGDAALSSVNDRMASARALLVQANSAASDPTSRAAIAGQIRSLRDSLIQVANTQRDGRPLFGGTAAVSAAYDSSGNYLGDNGAVSLPVAAGVTLQVNQSGTAVFGTHNNTDPTSGDVFQLLTSLANSIEAGDTTAMGAGLGQIDTATQRVALAQVNIGSRSSQLEDLTNSLQDDQVRVKQGISAKEDIDLAETIVNLKTQEAAYQAALQATAKVIQPTLLDFLR